MKRRLVLLIVLSTITLGGCSALQPLPDPQAPTPVSAAKVRIVPLASCWPGLPLLQAMASEIEDDQEGVVFELLGTHSEQAARMVDAGQAELALIAVFPSLPPVGERIALDRQVLIVPATSPLNALPRDEAIALLSGYRLDWAELGANAGRPEIVVREPGALGRMQFEEVVLGKAEISSAARILPNDGAIVDYVAAQPNAVGLVSSAWLDERVHVLAIEGLVKDESEDYATEPSLALELLVSPTASEATRDLAALIGSRRGRALIAERYALPEER